MNKITSLILGAGLIFMASTVMAAGTSLDSKWTCKTNASSSSSETEKQADDQMSSNSKSASEAFSFAAQHCRDCTKITCEINS